jgi:hypoxanthine phosphoribosyltransferase
VATSRIRFAHRSEEDLAKLLDFYRIEWEYEPRCFPIAWSSGGAPVEFFTPDFYLPEYHLYVEVTVIKPKLQTRKNRKVRLLRESHPGVRIKLLKRHDVQRLCGRLAAAS